MRVIALLTDDTCGTGLRGAEINGGLIADRRHPVIDDDRLHAALLRLRISCGRGRAGEYVPRLLGHHHLATGCREDREQADFELLPANRIPGNPNAVRRAEFRGAEVRAELFAREDKLAIRLATIDLLHRIVVSKDHELPFDRNWLVLVIVKIEPPAEAARGRLAGRVVHGGRPERHNSRGRLKQRFLFFGIGIPELVPRLAHGPIGRLAARCARHHCQSQHK